MPCLNCSKRTVGCHATCFEYILEKKKKDAQKQAVKQAKVVAAAWHNVGRVRMDVTKYRPNLSGNPTY